ncbi:MAG TPA: bifunctional riboflavin kinase/FAD synthetase, partial [Allosphingosinicella sp.]|nr:bifunctional riboflavin kinase/FAD synthetase [Allosphingosinicella sp.]
GGAAVPAQLRGGIVALGNFDGFHRGHQAVVGRAVSRARLDGRPALVATFDPHPMRYFRPESPWFRLTSLEQRERLMLAAGVDAMLVFQFDAEFAAITATDFVADWLARRIGATGVVTGEDFTFGKGRGGDIAALKLVGHANRLSVDTVAPVMEGDRPVSSTLIREALRSGDCETGRRLLTRPFTIEGVVEQGDRRGRTLGYPTANISLGNYLRPRFGVYAVRGRLPDGRTLDGVANLGVRPMFEPPRELLEPHFFGFDGALYGQRLEVELLSFIRDEQVFDDPAALTAQMDRDADEARRRLAA